MATLFLAFTVSLIFIFPFYCIYKPPNLLIRYFQHRWPDVLFHVSTSAKVVALTIDDAPSAHTREIMDVLRENGVTATFFVIGSQVAGIEQREILRDLVREGHELGNHAMRDEPARALSDEVLATQIRDVEAVIREAYAGAESPAPPKYFRPGSGFFSERMLKNVKGLGYRLVLGSIYPHDPQISFWRINARHVLSMLRPGRIVICHDRRSWTAPMLRRVLPEMTRRGYRVTTITGLAREV